MSTSNPSLRSDPTRSLAELEALGQGLPEFLVHRMVSLAAASPDPEAVRSYMATLRQRDRAAFERLVQSPAGLQYLIAVFSQSRFLSEEILQQPDWIDDLRSAGDLHRALSSEEFRSRLEHSLAGHTDVPNAFTLALFRRRRLLRILIRDVLGFAALAEVTEELSNLADAILEVSLARITASLAERYGTPLVPGRDGSPRACGFAILALGKLGGAELNYSSDIDLMFVYEENGETGGPASISNKEFFKKAANQLTQLLSTHTAEGFCYRVDLRLRPDGRHGEVCISLDGARRYYQSRARDWELQMLIKARCAAGDRATAKALLDFVEPLIYSTTLDFSAIETMSATRERLNEKLANRKLAPGGSIDVKLTRGGIRDIEFLVQCLQRLHGGRVPWVRHGGTLTALSRLQDKNLLSGSEYSQLASAYQFLRHLEHRLQWDEDRQTHMLPADCESLALVARRMPAPPNGEEQTADWLLRELHRHTSEVLEIYERIVHAQQPLYYTLPPPPRQPAAPQVASPPSEGSSQPVIEAHPPEPEPAAINLIRHLDQRAPHLAAAIQHGALRRGFRAFEHFLENIPPEAQWLEWLDQNEVLRRDVLEIFETSPYFAEQLIRSPELISIVREAALGDAEPTPPPPGSDATAMRRHFRREMLRIQAHSICRRTPIFETLARTSDLAEFIIQRAYALAVEHELHAHPPVSREYRPRLQMMAITLGRLGMREFDLGSDADLVFVLSDADAPELQFWTRVASKLIDILTAYTGEGLLFAVDTRLRPNGRSGPLVQTCSSVQDYFAQSAEAWEGIAYMKSRAVAGDIAAADRFLNDLQQVDWRRYGQSGRSRRDLKQMRMRLEKEQGPSNPLKAGRGGYYDIDFVLMYLRLKAAGFFFKVLNTPERIDVIEKMGHLDRHDAAFLRDAATFYRSLDHGMRLMSGQTEAALPSSDAQLNALATLVSRWTPQHLHDEPLPQELALIQEKTREVFDRLFT
jgi:glutamate-ammonia-ligase adenylyltransferase